jgi:hypothetical protein
MVSFTNPLHDETPSNFAFDFNLRRYSVELQQTRCGRVACLKLIACENLMDEWQVRPATYWEKPSRTQQFLNPRFLM